MGGLNRNDAAYIGGCLVLETTHEAVANRMTRSQLCTLLDHVIWVMSFASGTLLKDPVRVFEHGETAELQVRHLTVSPSAILRPFYFMHLQPIFERAIGSYSDRWRECEELRVVIELLLMGFDYTEPRLISTVTSIEHLTNRCLDEKDKQLMDRTTFTEMRCELETALDASSMSDEFKDHIRRAVARGNQLPFREKIGRLLQKWDVPLYALPCDTIRDLVYVRNVLAHGGYLRDDARMQELNLWDVYLAIRELITRIILKRIGYKGQYISYVGGQHTRNFPSCERQN